MMARVVRTKKLNVSPFSSNVYFAIFVVQSHSGSLSDCWLAKYSWRWWLLLVFLVVSFLGRYYSDKAVEGRGGVERVGW